MAIIEVADVSKCFRMRPDRPRSFQDLAVNLFRKRPHSVRDELFWALRDVSFGVNAGETLGIIGANGSGKSTCLKLLTRIIEPTSGDIRVNGRVAALLELGTGFHPELTGRENVFLNGSVLGLHRRQMASRLNDIISFAELERFIDIPVKFYSSGMYVRLAFATAINVSADILLVDEVLAVGDQSFQEKCLEHINEMKSRGITIVLVTHSLDAVRSLCSRAIWLDDGVLRQDGLTDMVVARYLEHVRTKDEGEARLIREAERSASALEATQHPRPKTRGKSADQATSGSSSSPPQTPPRTEQGASVDPVARHKGRWGSREAEIRDVRFYDREGRERLLLATGEPMSVVISYIAHERIETPVFGLAIYRNDGLHIGGSNTFLAKCALAYIEGAGEVHYIVETLPLLEGTYYLTAAIHNTTDTRVYDYQEFAYRFRVHLGSVAERYGTIYIPAHWKHLPVVEDVAGDVAG